MRFVGKNARLVVAATAVAVLAGIALVAYVLLVRVFWAQEALENIEPRYARLLGLREVQPQIESALADVNTTLQRNAYPANDSIDRLGTDLQQRVRRVAEAAGMSVAGSQILPVRAGAGFSQIPVAVTVEGNLEGLRALLGGLRTDSPVVQVDSIVIQSAVRRRRGRGPAESEERLTAQMNLSVLQLLP